jgi:hypothetical protein
MFYELEDSEAQKAAAESGALKVKYFEQLNAMYTDNIRAIDFKCNILIFFLSISVGAVTSFRPDLPAYLPIMLLLTVPTASIIILLWSIYPRTVRSSGSHFHVKAKVGADDFADPPDDEESFIRQLRDRCVILANILSRKVWLFKISIILCLVYHIVLLALLAIGGVMGFSIK